MSEQRHSPGPWRAACFAVYADKEMIAHTGIMGNHLRADTNEANARLIAAAPELLEACELVIGSLHIPDDDVSQEVKRRLTAASAKATGR